MDTRQNSFARWKRFTYLRCFIRKKLGGLREVLIVDVFREWRRVVVSFQQSRQRALLVADRVKTALMKAVWGTWCKKTRFLRCVRALRGKVTENRMTSDLRQRMRRWKKFTVVSVAMKKFVGRQALSIMRLALVEGFQRFTQRKRKERDLAKQIGHVHEAYLKEWLANKLQQRISVIEACEGIRRSGYSRRVLVSVWNGWMSFHAGKQTQQESIRQLRVQISHLVDRGSSLGTTKLADMLRRWKMIQISQSFVRWNEVAQSQQQTRLQTLKAMESWHKMQCRKYFRSWVRSSQYQLLHRRVRVMNMKFKLKRMWSLWQVFKAASLHTKGLNQSACKLHTLHIFAHVSNRFESLARSSNVTSLTSSTNSGVSSLFTSSEWRKFAAVEKTKHTQLTVARVVFEQKLMRNSFFEWKANAIAISYHRHQLQINTERLQVLLLCSSFRAWNSWSQQHKKLKTIMQILSTKCDSQTFSRIFTAWHLHTEKVIKLRQQALSFLRFRRMQKGVKGLRNAVQEHTHFRTIREKAQLFKSALSDNQVATGFARWK
ncbi:hypothetical protein PHMEG_00036197, partial [Phytophthora megakarya]